MTGVERCPTMRRGDDNSNTGFTDIQVTQAVDHGDTPDIPCLTNEYPDLLKLFQRHRFVSFIDEMQRALPFRIVADHALKNADGAVLGTKQLTRNPLCID